MASYQDQQRLKDIEIINHLITIEDQQRKILDELLLIKYIARYPHNQPLAEQPNTAAQAFPILRSILQSVLQEALVKKKSKYYLIDEEKNTEVLLVPSWKDLLRAEVKKFLKR
jgi:hypothetical protein